MITQTRKRHIEAPLVSGYKHRLGVAVFTSAQVMTHTAATIYRNLMNETHTTGICLWGLCMSKCSWPFIK